MADSVTGWDDAYVIADQVLDAKPYNYGYTSATWETCTLRRWLNEYFYQEVFTKEEQEAVIEQTLVNEGNEKYSTTGGNDTADKIYLPSIADMVNEEYGFLSDWNFDDQARIAKVTAYSLEQGANKNDEQSGLWWLRSPGRDTSAAATVENEGCIDSGFGVGNKNGGIRPALHLNLSSPLVQSTGKLEISVNSVSWDIVELGTYEGNSILWRGLEVSKDSVYLLADEVLENEKYNEEYKNITWRDSSLRAWLNGEFYEGTFTEEEKAGILFYSYANADNPWYDTEGGEDTQDRITLLSLGDIVKTEYGFPTDYHCGHPVRTAYKYVSGMMTYNRSWWLLYPYRTPF